MVGAALGYNDLTVIVAVFDSRETAERLLVEWGCVWKEGLTFRTKQPYRVLVTTEAFQDYYEKLGFSMYSTGASFAEGRPFTFLPVEVNKPCSGYNDD